MEEKGVNKTNTNGYTFTFAIILVVVLGTVLAVAATSLQPRQYENMRRDKMQQILGTVGIEAEAEEAEEIYNEVIVDQIVLDNQGQEKEETEAFDVDLATELKKSPEEQNFPLYVAELEGEQFYIIPLHGSGLWNAIFGYIALQGDMNTVKGVTFDHAGETPGLGAEITQQWFAERFVDEKIFDDSGNLVGVAVVKGQTSTSKDDNMVDAISGATITTDGLTDMLAERLSHYQIYFESQPDFNASNN